MKLIKNRIFSIAFMFTYLSVFLFNGAVVDAKTTDVSSSAEFTSAFKAGDDINLKNNIKLTSNAVSPATKQEIKGNGYNIDINNRVLTTNTLIDMTFKDVQLMNSKTNGFIDTSSSKSKITFDRVSTESLNNLLFSSATVIIKDSDLKLNKVLYGLSGTLKFEGTNKVNASSRLMRGSYLYFGANSNNDITVGECIGDYYGKQSGIIAEKGSTTKLNSNSRGVDYYQVYEQAFALKLEESSKFDVTVNSNFVAKNLQEINLAKNSQFLLKNNENSAAALIYLDGTIKVSSGAKLDVRNIGYNNSPGSLIDMRYNKKNITVERGGTLNLENNPSKAAIYANSEYIGGISIEGARVGVNGNNYQDVTGYLATSRYYAKAQNTSNSALNSDVQALRVYKLMIAPGEPAPVLSVKNNPVTYIKGSTVSHAKFLNDIGATTTNSSTAITSDFNTKVDFNTPGNYKVTLNQKLVSGVEATPIEVNVIILDEAKPIISINANNVSYVQGSNVSESKFLLDIGATSTNNSTPITSNFDSSVDFSKPGMYFVILNQKLVSGQTADQVITAVMITEAAAPVITIDETHLFDTAGTAPVITEEEVLKLYHASTDDGSKITIDANLRNLNKVGFYTYNATATNKFGKSSTVTVKMVVVHKTKTKFDTNVVNPITALHADSFSISLIEARSLTADQVKSMFFSGVVAFDMSDGTNLLTNAVVDQTMLDKIRSGRVEKDYLLPITVTHKGETVVNVIQVRVDLSL